MESGSIPKTCSVICVSWRVSMLREQAMFNAPRTPPTPHPVAVLFGAGLLTTGCPKKSPPTGDTAPQFTQAAVLAHRTQPYSWVEHTGQGAQLDTPGSSIGRVSETCTPTALPDGAPSLDLTDIIACRTTHPDGTVRTSLHGTHAVGAVYFAHRTDDGPWRFHSPKVHVPQTFAIGDAWAARHGTPPDQQLRRCDAEPTPWCADGVATTCVTLKMHHVTWVRNHWCPAHGHVGHEGLVVRVGAEPYWSWSSDLERAGQTLPDLPITARPVPELDRMMDLAYALTPDRLAELPPEAARIPE